MTSSRLTSVAADMRAKAKASVVSADLDAVERAGMDEALAGYMRLNSVDGQKVEVAVEWIVARHSNAIAEAMLGHAVALALADWLDDVAAARAAIDMVEAHNGRPLGTGSEMFLAQERHALALCDAYEGSVDMRAKGES